MNAIGDIHNVDLGISGTMNLKLVILLCVGFILFDNHYTRDAIGALQKQLESDLGITTEQYALLNLIYFIPNIFSPLLAGIVTQKYNRPVDFLLYSCILSGLGHFLFSCGVQSHNIKLLYSGRILSGLFYEIIDTFPVLITRPLFESTWSLVIGYVNALIRLGSVVNFLVTPHIYQSYSLNASFWFATAFGILSILLAIIVKYSKVILDKIESIMIPSSDSIIDNNNNGNSRTISKDDFHTIHTEEEDDNNSINDDNDVDNTQYDIDKEDYDDDDDDKEDYDDDDDDDDDYKNHYVEYDHHNNHCIDKSDQNSFDTDDIEHTGNMNILLKNNNTNNDIESNKQHQINLRHNNTVTNTPLSSRRNNSPRNSILNTFYKSLTQVFPFAHLSTLFYMYVLFGMFLYGSMVPFWFLGSKLLQERYGLSIQYADGLMILPEGMMVILSPIVGILINKYHINGKNMLYYSCFFCLSMPIAFLLLLFGYNDTSRLIDDDVIMHQQVSYFIHPIIPLLILGSGYACTTTLFWSNMINMCVPEYISFSTGVLACSVNILPSFLPTLITIFSIYILHMDEFITQLIVLSIMGFVAAIFAWITAMWCPMTTTGTYSTVSKDQVNSNKSIKKSPREERIQEYLKSSEPSISLTTTLNIIHTRKSKDKNEKYKSRNITTTKNKSNDNDNDYDDEYDDDDDMSCETTSMHHQYK